MNKPHHSKLKREGFVEFLRNICRKDKKDKIMEKIIGIRTAFMSEEHLFKIFIEIMKLSKKIEKQKEKLDVIPKNIGNIGNTELSNKEKKHKSRRFSLSIDEIIEWNQKL